MPLAVYVLGLGIFALTTSEYMVSGLMPALSAEFDVSFAAVGYLVTVYAGAMAVGGPLLTVALLKLSRKNALLGLVVVFVAGQVLGAMAQNYGMMVAARLVTAVAAAAFFGVALTACAELVGGEKFARASSLVLGGLMFGTVLGLPAATLVGEQFGWRISFAAVAGVAVLVGLLLAKALPPLPAPPSMPMAGQLAIFRSGKLWAVYATSLLLIGATFAGFTYFVPILTEVTGFSEGIVPLLLVIYGVATIVGNNVVGRLADRFTIQVLAVGLVVTIAAMVLFALFAQSAVVAIAALVVIGLTGVSMNPALVTRGARIGQNNMMVNSVHTACIMLGVMVGSWIGGLGINGGLGLRGPLWIGAVLAVLGLLTLVPDMLALRRSSPVAEQV
ncbi:MFS transporter [Umezawaea sp. Da 62-37]|uniref:MFS transporter n=1 Tax=Umezawaea sp. Da 62-37 TaxID=3075927 RepID=UPI0028F74E1B|nr:MFS transporter [Umezawaea sp. Da 62-37]WNV85404.1 MFS transporter [Umezawaea sp. Da 62-37]